MSFSKLAKVESEIKAFNLCAMKDLKMKSKLKKGSAVVTSTLIQAEIYINDQVFISTDLNNNCYTGWSYTGTKTKEAESLLLLLNTGVGLYQTFSSFKDEGLKKDLDIVIYNGSIFRGAALDRLDEKEEGLYYKDVDIFKDSGFVVTGSSNNQEKVKTAISKLL